MKDFCEIVVSIVLPSVRSIVTKDMIEKHGLTQEETAELLGITQPAVSQYLKEYRAVKVRTFEKNSELMRMVDDLTNEIIGKKVSQKEFAIKICEICRKLKDEGMIAKIQRNMSTHYECPLEL